MKCNWFRTKCRADNFHSAVTSPLPYFIAPIVGWRLFFTRNLPRNSTSLCSDREITVFESLSVDHGSAHPERSSWARNQVRSEQERQYAEFAVRIFRRLGYKFGISVKKRNV